MKTILFIFLAGLTACATDSGHSASTLSDGSVVHTVRCEESWDGCYLTASKICGELGFEEVARTSDGAVSSAGRLERMHTIEGGIEDHRYSENARVEAYNRVITIRCGPER
jgi:hypothetical protein